MTNEEIIAFLLQSQKSLDSQLHQVVETMDRLEDNLHGLQSSVEKLARTTDFLQSSMREWHEDRHQVHLTMTNVLERMDKYAADAETRSKEADARMTRLEKLFERSISRGSNGQH